MSLPPAYLTEIESLSREILRTQPIDILQFCANYFGQRLETERAGFLTSTSRNRSYRSVSPGTVNRPNMAGNTFPGRLGTYVNPFGGDGSGAGHEQTSSGTISKVIEEDENDTITSPTTPSFGFSKGIPSFGASFGGDATAGDFPPSSFKPASEGFPEHYGMGRRTSVSAESLNPTASSNDNWSPPYHQKTQEQVARLQKSISGNFLFSHLDDEQSAQVLGALVEKPIPAVGIKVITQGDQGDFFYVVEKGSFDVHVNSSGWLQPGSDGLGTKVATIEPGGSFGELALMYNAPRAATVISAEASCTLWALDRITFRRILMDSTFQRRRLYESFLEEVPLLSTLTRYERSKIADALETQKYPPGTSIITEGDAGEAFYLLESGEAEAYKRGVDNPVKLYHKGDYFGELALLNDAPRAASVISKTEVKVATLGKNGFQRLLGPVESIMRRTKYESVESIDPLHQK
ncbi:putative cAMP-dependent protein kinase regulatory subunit [Sclerotinia borealis F-4128]|uniref:cAMP-dependent protein kinase regulatory subunit n=1 Tax=Sclerotinia borealis (strain F-4128) TaxID=1432307 RepID=W9CL82_SCLBF|nr:putative cAMP-dependent protein kinase regulatory subunit [Sclerotinia borealis F-4128]